MILPLFVRHGQGIRREIASMPGQYQLSPDTLVEVAGQAWELGIRAVILFGIPARKDEVGSEALDTEGIIPAGYSHSEASLAGSARDYRRMFLRIHQPRSLRRAVGTDRAAGCG
jgi:porphobilinogen synthase